MVVFVNNLDVEDFVLLKCDRVRDLLKSNVKEYEGSLMLGLVLPEIYNNNLGVVSAALFKRSPPEFLLKLKALHNGDLLILVARLNHYV